MFSVYSWTLILYEIIKRVISYNSLRDLWECYGLWNAIAIPLKICQTAAFLEVKYISSIFKFIVFKVAHAIFGLVRSNPMIVFIQIISRVFLVWGVANYIPHVGLLIHLNEY